jgi:hypothetical protein
VTFLNGRKSDISIWWTHGVEAALGAGIRRHLAPSLLFTADSLARRYTLVALIVVKLRKG